MRIKRGIKISLSILLVTIIIASGIIMFQKLNHNKEVFETDLYTHIPSKVTGILQINREKSLKTISHSFPELQNIIDPLSAYLTYPVLLTEENQNIYIISKVTSEQESKIKSLLRKTLFSSFAPKSRSYKDAKILFYPAENNRFFSCMFYQGFFVGGYNYTLLEDFVNTGLSDNIFSNKQAGEIAGNINSNYSANLYLNNQTYFTAFNIDLNKDQIDLEGTTNNTFLNSWPNEIRNENDSIAIDYSIFPDSLISYTINTTTASISSSLICLFNIPSYTFILEKDQKSPIYAFKHMQSRFDIYNHLNKLEINYINRKFSTRDVVLRNQHIYKTSEQMGREVFHHDSLVYLAFYKNYLLVSKSRDILIHYLKGNGRYKIKNSLDPIKINPQTISLFYHNDIPNFASDTSNSHYLLERIKKGNIYTRTYIENGDKKIKISLNN